MITYEKQSYTQWVFKNMFLVEILKLASLSQVLKIHNGKVIYLDVPVM